MLKAHAIVSFFCYNNCMIKEESVGLDEISEQEIDEITKPKLRKTLNNVWTILLVVFSLIAIPSTVIELTFDKVFVDGKSMAPTLNDFSSFSDASNYVEFGLMNPGKNAINNLKRGDIVVFDRSNGENGNKDLLIKRLIALPGETILLTDNPQQDEVKITTVNNETIILNEDYLSEQNKYYTVTNNYENYGVGTPYYLAEGQYFFMGDNRINSQDSRVIGSINYSQIVGKLVVIQGYYIKKYNANVNEYELTKKTYYNIFSWRFY